MTDNALPPRMNDRCVAIPEIGLELRVCTPPGFMGKGLELIETINAPGYGPPLHRHSEAEVFYILQGRYLFEVDGKRLEAKTGDTVVANSGVAHRFVNIDSHPSRQLVMIVPGFDALAFFSQLGSAMKGGRLDSHAKQAFSTQWGVDFLGPPLQVPSLAAASEAGRTVSPTAR
jgi:mannose-6-phosphate isomerase-like protein (cupin superfamily)